MVAVRIEYSETALRERIKDAGGIWRRATFIWRAATSREESRRHVHVNHADGEAKFWLEPQIEPAQYYGLNDRQIRAAEALIRKHDNDIRAAWRKHFGR